MRARSWRDPVRRRTGCNAMQARKEVQTIGNGHSAASCPHAPATAAPASTARPDGIPRTRHHPIRRAASDVRIRPVGAPHHGADGGSLRRQAPAAYHPWPARPTDGGSRVSGSVRSAGRLARFWPLRPAHRSCQWPVAECTVLGQRSWSQATHRAAPPCTARTVALTFPTPEP